MERDRANVVALDAAHKPGFVTLVSDYRTIILFQVATTF
jgi:hypothetical protein